MSYKNKIIPCPKITVGLFVYNGEAFITETIESILSQTFNDFQIIISDNCSKDQTQSICKSFVKQDSRVKYFRQKNNIGMLENFNFVLENANSEFFIWMSHDDLFHPDFFSTCLEEFQKDKKLTSVFTSFSFIDKNKNILKSNIVLNLEGNSICDQLKNYWNISSIPLQGYLGWATRDCIMYSLTKTEIVKNKFKLKNWSWPNNKSVTNQAHIVANYLLASGKFKCVKGYDFFHKRVRRSISNNAQTSFFKKIKEKILGCILALQLILRTFFLIYRKKTFSYKCLFILAILLLKFQIRIIITYLFLSIRFKVKF